MAAINLEELKDDAQAIAVERGIPFEEALELVVNRMEEELINAINLDKQKDPYFWKVESFKQPDYGQKVQLQGFWKQVFKNGRGSE